jgi:hypothetical protein
MDLVRHEGYAQAQAAASLVLWTAPLPLLLAAFVAVRSSPRAFVGVAWATPSAVLLAIVARIDSLPVGRYLWAGRCELLDAREAILGGPDRLHLEYLPGNSRLRQTCWDLSLMLNDPQERAGVLGTETLDVVVPDFKQVQDRCLADFFEWAQNPDRSARIHRGEILHSPYVDDRNRAEVTATLDRIAPEEPRPLDAGIPSLGPIP